MSRVYILSLQIDVKGHRKANNVMSSHSNKKKERKYELLTKVENLSNQNRS